MAAIAHRLECCIDLAECGLGHGGVCASLREEDQCDAFIAKTPGPLERHALACLFLQRLTIGEDGLFKPRRSALASSKSGKHIAQIILGHGPLERYPLAGPFLQRLAIGDNGLPELRRPALACSED